MNPFDQAWWNAHQTLAWVFTRNRRLIALLTDEEPPVSTRFAINQSGIYGPTETVGLKASESDFFAMTNRPGAEYDSQAEATFALRSALQAGRLSCWGSAIPPRS